MDAFRGWRLFRYVPLFLLGTGCSLFDRSTDRLVESELREAKSTMRKPTSDPLGMSGPVTVRPQAPAEGPIAPKILPVDPTPTVVPAAPITPTAPVPLAPSAPTISTVSASKVVPPASSIQPITSSLNTPPETRVKVVATVGADGLITDEDVSIMMRQRASDYIRLTGPERDAKEKEVYKQELRRLIERELIISEFLSKIKKNKPQLLDELWDEAGRMADKQMREIRRLMGVPDESTFAQLLQSQGVTIQTYKRQMERAALSSIYLNQFQRDKAKNVGLPQVQEYYKKHAEEFRIEDRVKWQHIFVSRSRFNSEADAKLYSEWMAKTLGAGADFAQMAKEYGHGDSALRSGEGSGTKRGEIQPVELESTVMSLKAGQTSGLISGGTGYHIVRVLERETAGVRPLDDKVQAEIRMKLSEQAFKQERDRIITELWRKTTVVVSE